MSLVSQIIQELDKSYQHFRQKTQFLSALIIFLYFLLCVLLFTIGPVPGLAGVLLLAVAMLQCFQRLRKTKQLNENDWAKFLDLKGNTDYQVSAYVESKEKNPEKEDLLNYLSKQIEANPRVEQLKAAKFKLDSNLRFYIFTSPLVLIAIILLLFTFFSRPVVKSKFSQEIQQLEEVLKEEQLDKDTREATEDLIETLEENPDDIAAISQQSDKLEQELSKNPEQAAPTPTSEKQQTSEEKKQEEKSEEKSEQKSDQKKDKGGSKKEQSASQEKTKEGKAGKDSQGAEKDQGKDKDQGKNSGQKSDSEKGAGQENDQQQNKADQKNQDGGGQGKDEQGQKDQESDSQEGKDQKGENQEGENQQGDKKEQGSQGENNDQNSEKDKENQQDSAEQQSGGEEGDSKEQDKEKQGKGKAKQQLQQVLEQIEQKMQEANQDQWQEQGQEPSPQEENPQESESKDKPDESQKEEGQASKEAQEQSKDAKEKKSGKDSQKVSQQDDTKEPQSSALSNEEQKQQQEGDGADIDPKDISYQDVKLKEDPIEKSEFLGEETELQKGDKGGEYRIPMEQLKDHTPDAPKNNSDIKIPLEYRDMIGN